MSNILLKRIQESFIEIPNSNEIRLFSNFDDNGNLYYRNSDGSYVAVGGGSASTYNPVISKTYTELYNLYLSGSFATGSYYLINNYETIYDQPDFYMDGTTKLYGASQSKSCAFPYKYQPILVLATSYNTLSPNAYQPPYSVFGGYAKDQIKYDLTKNTTEYGNSTRGRIIERIDEYGNRTDYDHKTIRFRRYRNYDRGAKLSGSIVSYNATTGQLTGNGSTLFLSEISIGDIILIDTLSDLGYNFGLKVNNISFDNIFTSVVDNDYSTTPPVVFPFGVTNFSFSGKSYDFYSVTATTDYNQYKEVYIGQSQEQDFDEFYTFDTPTTSLSNYLDDYSVFWNSSSTFPILSNNIFGSNATSNYLGKGSCNNDIKDHFNSNNLEKSFSNNICDSYFQYNNSVTDISNVDFTLATYVYATYSCSIFKNSAFVNRLSYYDGDDVLNIIDINS